MQSKEKEFTDAVIKAWLAGKLPSEFIGIDFEEGEVYIFFSKC